MKIKKLILLLTIFALFAGCTPQTPPVNTPVDIPQDILPVTPSAPEPNKKIRIVAVGDNLLHNTVSSFCKSGDSFDYAKLYTHISPFAQAADLAFINQEVPLAGPVGAYPVLSAPFDVAKGLKASGFNIINQASNHSLDKGEKGLLASLAALKAENFDAVLGSFSSQEEADTLQIVEKQGVNFGFLSYTYGTNGIPVPGDKQYLVSLIDESKIQADLALIREKSDFVIVSMHWGAEYQFAPNKTQKALAQKLADWGADMIIGHHPHVIQPMERLTAVDGRSVVCAYSLGNFVSGQHKVSTMLGGMLDATLEFTPQGALVGVDAGIMPLITHFEGKATSFDIYPIDEYTEALAAKHGISNWEKAPTLDTFRTMASDVLGADCLMEGRR